MADQKLTDLSALTTFSGDELFYVVEDDDGTPLDRKVTVENLATGLLTRPELDPLGMYATATPNAVDDEFEDGSIAGGWTQLNVTGTVTWTEGKHALTGQVTGDVTSGDINAILKAGTIAVGESFECAIRLLGPSGTTTGVLLVLTDGVISTSVPCAAGFITSATHTQTWALNGGTMTSYSGSVVGSLSAVPWPIKVRIRRSASTTYNPEYSTDGVVWSSMEVAALTSSTTHTHFGIAMTNVAGINTGLARIEYVRKY